MFYLINFGLAQFKKRKFSEYHQSKLNFIQRSLIGILLGLLFSFAGAIKIVYYPEFDKSFDLFFIEWLVFVLMFDEVSEFFALSRKIRQLRTFKSEV